MPTRPEPVTTCRDTRNGVSPAMMAENGVCRDIR